MTQAPSPQGPDNVVVINDASVARGGATGLALLSIRLLRARGLPVTLITGDAGDAPELAALGVEIVALGQERLLSAGKLRALRLGLHNGAASEMIAGYIAEHDTSRTVYHVHGWAQILSPALFCALRPVAPRVLTHAHDMFLSCPNGVFMDFQTDTPCTRVPLSMACLKTHCDKRSYPEKLWRVERTRRLRRAFDQGRDWGPVALIHPGMKDLLAKGGIRPERLHVVRNPASAWTADRIPAERNEGVLFVGRIDRDKGVDLLAAAARDAKVPVTFAGEGPYRATLMEAYPEFTYTGWLAKDQIGEVARTARALVMPSRHPEPFGLVAAEASMSGLPVVLSASALLAQDVAEADVGVTYEPGEAGLAAALRKVAAMDQDLLQAMSLRAFACGVPLAQSEADWVDALLAHYHTMMSSQAA